LFPAIFMFNIGRYIRINLSDDDGQLHF